MKHSKFVVAGLCLVVSLTLLQAPVLASGGSPWDEIRQQIAELFNRTNNLQAQVNSIETTPGPAGPQGEQGLQGIQGVPGSAGSFGTETTYVKLVDVPVPPRSEWGGFTIGYARCDSGDKLISGGVSVNADDTRILASRPYSSTDWYGAVSNQIDVAKIMTISVLCADSTP